MKLDLHARAGLCAGLFFLGVFTGGPAPAQTTIPQEYDKTIQSARVVGSLGTDLFGEKINFYTGATSFSATDVSLPGNSNLPVQLGRRLIVKSREPAEWHMETSPFGDWELDIPHMYGVFAAKTGWQVKNLLGEDPNKRCSAQGGLREPPVVEGSFNGLWESSQYWYGYHRYAPGAGDQEILVANAGNNPHKPTDGKDYRWVTNDQWYFSCLPKTANGVAGEGFLASAPDGTKYTFNWVVQTPTSYITKQKGMFDPIVAPAWDSTSGIRARPSYLRPGMRPRFPVGDLTSLSRVEVWILPTKVEDRFGNTVTYTYDPAKPWRLTKIAASDGRQLTLAYNGNGHIASVSDGTRSWTYTYNGHTLTAVTLPDASKWTFAGNAQSAYTQPRTDNVVALCEQPSSKPTQNIYALTITHPSGAVGEFKFKPMLHGRSYVPKLCIKFDPYGQADYARYPFLFDVVGIIQKKITGPGLPTYQWTYTYGPPNNNWAQNCPNNSCPATKTVEVAGPGEFARYTFGNKYKETDGLLLKVERGAGAASILRTETTSYLLNPVGQPYPAIVGLSPYERGDQSGMVYKPVLQRQIVQQGTTFTWLAQGFDPFANPTKATRSSTLGYSRTDMTAYHHNTAKWVIGQVASSTNTNTNLVEAKTDYDALARPWRTYAFGKLQQTLAYNADGTLLNVKDGKNNTTSFASWKRGIPQKIIFADAKFKSAVVNNIGGIDAVTDENGYTTKYLYDPIGRLKTIDYPDADTVNWTSTTLSFAKSGAAIYGLPAGHWEQTVATGNGRKVTYFDALWRPAVQATYDAGNTAGTLSQTVTRFDAQGRPTFVSYPQRSQNAAVYNTWANPAVNPNAQGTWTTYDALGRATKVQQNSELGLLTTATEYVAGFQTRITNPRGFKTTTAFMAYDQPSTDWPMAITHPEGAYTRFTRDVFGKPTAILRHNANNSSWNQRYIAYHPTQEICKTTEVETGTTAYAYDAAGNLEWSAAALPWSPLAPCGYSKVNAHVVPRRVDRTYDARNQLKTLTFPDGLGNQSLTYKPDGRLATISADNGAGNLVTTTYEYNKRRLPVSERLTWGAVDWSLGYGYNANGHLASQTQPVAPVITYLPNALGQPTQAGTYATGVKYFPNGAIQQFTYGNGLIHTLTQNVRGLPDTSCDFSGTCNASAVLNDGYDYDQHGNVAAISDGRTLHRGNRTMTYDGLDRLKTTVSPMFGNAAYAYDVLDNMTRATIGGPAARDHYYCYDVHNRLTNVKTGGCNGISVMGLGYDERGNLANKNGVSFVFDYGNRLRSTSAGPSSYVYDGHGRRARDFVGGSKYSLYGQTGQLAFASDLRTGKYSNYVYLGGSLVAMREQPHVPGPVITKYLHTDGLGTPVAVTSQNKAIIEKSEYEPYGRLINRPLKDGPDYTGHVADAATAMLYAQQRYLMTDVPVFPSTDPVGVDTRTGRNFGRYLYGANNPYRFRDPDGRHVCAVGTKTNDCNAFKDALKEAEAASHSNRLSKQEQTIVKNAVDFYGTEGDPSVVISFEKISKGDANVKVNEDGTATVTFDLSRLSRDTKRDSSLVLGKVVTHEGDHGARIKSGEAGRVSRFGLEVKGYAAQAYFQKATNFMDYDATNGWTSWGGIDMRAIEGQAKLSVVTSCGSMVGCD